MCSIADFSSRFAFDPQKALCVGVERERFITVDGVMPVPRAADVLRKLGHRRFGYELSACQLENRTDPVPIHKLHKCLREDEDIVAPVLESLGLRSLHREVGPDTMPLDVYPDPAGRYRDITKQMSRSTLLAACQIIGTHIHVGMPDRMTALRVYNQVIGETAHLAHMGDGSAGRRLAIYRAVTPGLEPQRLETWEDFFEAAQRGGFAEDPRRCWTLIRISVHGTIEFRMFGSTDSIDRIVLWARVCHMLCRDAMA